MTEGNNFFTMQHGDYMETREQILKSDYRRYTRPVKAIRITSKQSMTVHDPQLGELEFKISSGGFASLLHILKIDNKSFKAIDRAVGSELTTRVLNMIAEKLASTTEELTFLIKPDLMNPSNSKVIHFTKEKSPVATAKDYIRELERIMNDNPDLELRSINMDAEGKVRSTMVNPNWGFEIGGMKGENFNSGIYFSMDGSGLYVNPYAMRLICTNGMVGARSIANYALTKASPEHRDRFMKALEDITNMRFHEETFSNQARTMDKTRASLSEMQQAYNIVNRHVDTGKLGSLTMVNDEIPWLAVKKLYKEKGYDLDKYSKNDLSNAPSNMSLWELVNAMTYIASNNGEQNVSLQEAAGMFMSRANDGRWDLGGGIPQIF